MLSCPVPQSATELVLLGHGSGGKLSSDLLRQLFLPAFSNPLLDSLGDGAVLELSGERVAFTTDSYVVRPLFFPGGDIGSLAVHGTVNDLAMMGARPEFLSASFILEEGFEVDQLRRIVASMAAAAREAGVWLVTGDTKVVERGKGDGVFINTTGVGSVRTGLAPAPQRARPGDVVLVSGSLGDHGVAILSVRQGLEFETGVVSDSAALHGLVQAGLRADPDPHVLRDPTRGGLASALNEIAAASHVGIEIEEESLPVQPAVQAACELLGLDPLYVANEGKLVWICAPERADALLAELRQQPLGRQAARIGTVSAERPGLVSLRTRLGTQRIVDTLVGEQLPRIC